MASILDHWRVEVMASRRRNRYHGRCKFCGRQYSESTYFDRLFGYKLGCCIVYAPYERLPISARLFIQGHRPYLVWPRESYGASLLLCADCLLLLRYHRAQIQQAVVSMPHSSTALESK